MWHFFFFLNRLIMILSQPVPDPQPRSGPKRAWSRLGSAVSPTGTFCETPGISRGEKKNKPQSLAYPLRGTEPPGPACPLSPAPVPARSWVALPGAGRWARRRAAGTRWRAARWGEWGGMAADVSCLRAFRWVPVGVCVASPWGSSPRSPCYGTGGRTASEIAAAAWLLLVVRR